MKTTATRRASSHLPTFWGSRTADKTSSVLVIEAMFLGRDMSGYPSILAGPSSGLQDEGMADLSSPKETTMNAIATPSQVRELRSMIPGMRLKDAQHYEREFAKLAPAHPITKMLRKQIAACKANGGGVPLTPSLWRSLARA